MTSQLLTRIPTELKKQFEQRVQADGTSMNFVITAFMQEYVKNPSILQTHVDDEALDRIMERVLTSQKAKKASISLHKAIKSA